MRLLVLASLLIPAAGLAQDSLTFDEAMELAAARPRESGTGSLEAEIAELRRARLPSVRAEVTANTSRTLHLITDQPFELHAATSVVAFDYPLWDGGATRSRIEAAEAKLRRVFSREGLDDARFALLLDVFADLYLTQRQSAISRPLLEEIKADTAGVDLLLAAGEMSNLNAADRRDVELFFASRNLETEARRIEMATRLRLLTGLESEPALAIDLSEPAVVPPTGDLVARDDRVELASLAVQSSRARLEQVTSANSFRAFLSGMVGIGVNESDLQPIDASGSFGIYSLRLHLTWPILPGEGAISIAEARADLQQTLDNLDAAIEASRARGAEYRLRSLVADERIELLSESVEISREREESLGRLVSAGLRTPSELTLARAERARREMDLLAVRIERWKSVRMLERIAAKGEPGPS